MRKHSLLFIVSAIIFSLIFIPVDTASAAIADGTYQVSYEVKQSGSNNTSIADGYFSKPATLIVSGGKQTIQLTLTGAEMIKSLSGPNGGVTVVSDSGSTRVVKFSVNDVTQRTKMSMRISVPDLYDSNHTADLVFNTSGLATVSSGSGGSDATNNSSGTDGKVVDNPKTGDESSIVLYTLLMIGAIGAFIVVRKLRPAQD